MRVNVNVIAFQCQMSHAKHPRFHCIIRYSDFCSVCFSHAKVQSYCIHRGITNDGCCMENISEYSLFIWKCANSVEFEMPSKNIAECSINVHCSNRKQTNFLPVFNVLSKWKQSNLLTFQIYIEINVNLQRQTCGLYSRRWYTRRFHLSAEHLDHRIALFILAFGALVKFNKHFAPAALF